MPYALRHTHPSGGAMLVEVTRQELQADADRYGGNPHAERIYPHLERVSGAYAHRWVREGLIHGTPLYIGEDRHGRRRVLYARDGF